MSLFPLEGKRMKQFLDRLPLALFALSLSVFAAVPEDLITSLPGWSESFPSKQYSGYLDIDGESFIHYWFVQSESDPVNDPVVLWLNGGPGCSSMDGFFYELGPFELTAGGTKLSLRPYRWNRIANMLFLEAPVGVGFSYSTTQNYNNTDDRTALDNRKAIEKFYSLYPEYKKNPLFLTGESYAGIYVPTLAEAILKGVDDASYTGAALAGIAVGNGCTGYEAGICGYYYTYACQGLYYEMKFLLDLPFIDKALKDLIDAECDWQSCASTSDDLTTVLSESCLELVDQASIMLGEINVYNVYGQCVFDSCAGPDDKLATGRVSTRGVQVERLAEAIKKLRSMTTLASRTPATAGLKKIISPHYFPSDHSATSSRTSSAVSLSGGSVAGEDDDGLVRGPVGCIDSGAATNYLMNPAVQKAIHVRDPEYCWAVCNQAKGFRYEPTRANLPRDTYPYLISRIKVLIYNGDWDACVPYTDNQAWTENMGYEASSPWHVWTYTAQDRSAQIGGYNVIYDVKDFGVGSFEFRTVRGAGHMVPTDTPAQGLAVLSHLLGVNESHVYPTDSASDSDESSTGCSELNHAPGRERIVAAIATCLAVLIAVTVIIYLLSELKKLQKQLRLQGSDSAVNIEMGGRQGVTQSPLTYAKVNAQDFDSSSH